MAFTNDGSELLIGRSNGFIEVMDPAKGNYLNLQQPLVISDIKTTSPITGIIVSPCGNYFAVMEVNCGVSLFKKDYLPND